MLPIDGNIFSHRFQDSIYLPYVIASVAVADWSSYYRETIVRAIRQDSDGEGSILDNNRSDRFILKGNYDVTELRCLSTRKCGAIMLSVCVRVTVSVCPVQALSFESLDLQTSLLVGKYVFKISRSTSRIKVIGSRSMSRSREHIACLCVLCEL